MTCESDCESSFFPFRTKSKYLISVIIHRHDCILMSLWFNDERVLRMCYLCCVELFTECVTCVA